MHHELDLLPARLPVVSHSQSKQEQDRSFLNQFVVHLNLDLLDSNQLVVFCRTSMKTVLPGKKSFCFVYFRHQRALSIPFHKR